MKSIIFYIITICSFIFVNGQVGIGTDTHIPHSSKILDLQGGNAKGFRGPTVALTSLTNPAPITTPVEGLMVYNTATTGNLVKGYYSWDEATTSWVLLGEANLSTVIDSKVKIDLLGYVPVNYTSGVAPASIIGGGVTFNKKGECLERVTPSGDSHFYCAYLAANSSWLQAFSAAKSIKGYLVTVTTTEEWQWLRTNMLDATSTINLAANRVWLGYSRVYYDGNRPEYYWITGEESKIIWSDNSTTESYFGPNEPSISGAEGAEGCAHLWEASTHPNREWNDASCITNYANLAIIVEFGEY